MATNYTTPNMNLLVPVVGAELAPTWASDLDTSLGTIDSHNHSSGSGVQITPAGLNINATLTFNSNAATNLGIVGFTAQGTGVAAPVNASFYVSGVDLYYQDGNGNTVRITSGGAVNATSSGISSGTASASFVSSVLVVTQSTGVGAPIDAATYILRYNGSYPSPSGNYILLAAPSSLSGGYQLTLPATTPSATSFMQMDTSGNVTASVAVSGGINTSNLANAGVTRPKLASVGQQVSSSSGNFTTTNFGLTAVTNLSVTITTSGRPVVLLIQPDGTSNNSNYLGQLFAGSAPTSNMLISFFRGATNLGAGVIRGQQVSAIYLDAVSSGTYTYTVQVGSDGTGTAAVQYMVLVAYEL